MAVQVNTSFRQQSPILVICANSRNSCLSKTSCNSCLIFYPSSMRFPLAFNPVVRCILGINLRDDAPGHRLQDKGEGALFHRRLSFDDVIFDANERRKNTLDVALDFLACGLDPKKSVFFKTSKHCRKSRNFPGTMPTLTPMAMLENAHSYKDKIAKGIAPMHGLFAYPVLMADRPDLRFQSGPGG